MIAIRVNSSYKEGIGHLVRMIHFAKELRHRGYEVLFLTDSASAKDFLESFDFILIDAEDEVSDAQKVRSLLQAYDVEYLVVDSYRLGKVWEDLLRDGYRIIAFDDIAREHSAHYVIDPKYCDDYLSRYDGKVSEDTQLLLGPQYKIFSDAFRDFQPYQTEKREILFSLGGGGDFSLLSSTIEALGECNDLILHIVVGPYSKNYEAFAILPNVMIHKNLHSLIPLYQRASLFVGALGGSFFEATLCHIPAITFPIAENQKNSIYDLEALGQYLYLPFHEAKEDFSKVVKTAVQHLPRLKALVTSAKVPLDPYGVVRIADAIFKNHFDHIEYSSQKSQSIIWQKKNIQIRQVTDHDINHYLDSRNLPANQENMNVTQTIPRANHYHWWFNNQRESYAMIVDGETKLYIWHQQVHFQERDYLIGGWFVCQEEMALEWVMMALTWQLEYTAQLYPSAKWIAIIKKSNRFVNLLNRRAGFIEATDPNDIAAIDYFFQPKPGLFNYVVYESV